VRTEEGANRVRAAGQHVAAEVVAVADVVWHEHLDEQRGDDGAEALHACAGDLDWLLGRRRGT
jgi:hypothetical protein